jgi:hypothetical protein
VGFGMSQIREDKKFWEELMMPIFLQMLQYDKVSKLYKLIITQYNVSFLSITSTMPTYSDYVKFLRYNFKDSHSRHVGN